MSLIQKNKSQNIIEYVIFIYQVEDIVRLFNFDKNAILEFFLGSNFQSVDEIEKSFYEKILSDMSSEGIEKNGHLDEIKEIIIELVYLHNSLLTILNNEKYKELTSFSAGDISDYKSKSNLKDNHDVEVLLHAMYMKLQMKIRKQNIGLETEEAMERMRKQLTFLSEEYKKMKSGDWNFIQN